MKRWVLIVGLLSCSAVGFAETPQDGYMWMNANPSFKLGYVVGFLQASDTAGSLMLATCMSMLNYLDLVKVSGQKWKDMCLNDKSYDFSGVSMGQFVDGVDAFYRDYRNKNLEVGFALQYVRDQMHGKSQQDLNAEVVMWQQVTQDAAKAHH